MRLRAVLGEVLPVCGTIGLLGLWLFQQIGIEKRSDELREIANARLVYETYQSHNAVFNAVNEGLTQETASSKLRTYQTYNYELGLTALEHALPPDRKQGIPPALGTYDGTSTFAQKMERTQVRLEALQVALGKYEQAVRDEASREKRLYMTLYLLISVLSFLGAILKVIEKLAPVRSKY